MSDFTRKDFNATIAEKARQRTTQQIPGLQMIQAAGAVMAKLTTQSDEWNRYLSYLQGQIDKTRERVAAARLKQDDPALWDVAKRNKLKADILQGEAMIAALEWAMALPKALVDGGAEATEFLNKLERENGETTGKTDS